MQDTEHAKERKKPLLQQIDLLQLHSYEFVWNFAHRRIHAFFPIVYPA